MFLTTPSTAWPSVEVADDFGALLGTALFEDRTARDHDVAAAAVHLEDLERLLEAHERACVAHGAHIDLGAGQERHGAAEIDGEAALDAAEDRALDAGVVGICLLETVPGFLAACHFAADDGFAAGILCLAEEDLDLVADGDVGIFAGIREFLEIDAAFHLVADIDDGLARLDGDDLAFDDRALVGRVHFEAFVEEGLEFLHGCVLSHVAYVFPLTSLCWPGGCLRRSWVGRGRCAKQRGPVIPTLLDPCPAAFSLW